MLNLKKNLKPSYKIKLREEFNFFMNFFNHEKYKYVSEKDYKIDFVKSGLEEKVYLQKVHDICSQGSYTVYPNDIKIIIFENAIITEGSDFIRLNQNRVYNPCFNFTVNKYYITNSSDFLKKSKQSYILKKVNVSRNYNLIFNLVSNNTSWSHYLAIVLPKIRLISKLNINEVITIVTNEINDQQIIELIKISTVKFENIQVVNLIRGESIYCKKIYHVELDSYISSNGFLSSPHSIFISKFTRDYWLELKDKLVKKSSIKGLKLFIGRKGLRNISNYEEIRDFFISIGFVEVFPENFSLVEKVETFNSASHIVGPASSGFSNIIFCKEKTKVVWFINFARTLDTYLPTYCIENKIDFFSLIGEDECPEDLNSNFYIDIETIKSYFNNDYFSL